jgi:hypothetical protein
MNGKRRQYKGYTFVAEELHGIKIIRLGSPSIDNTSTEEV